MPPQPVDPAAFDWASSDGPAEEIRRIARASTAHDGASTLNEHTLLGLKHHGLDGAELWLADGGFALLRGPDLTLAVEPGSRGHGTGGRLAEAALAARAGRPVEAWSHADHPAAAALAHRLGIARARALVVMSRPTSLPVTVPPLPDGVLLRGFEPGDEEAILAVNAAAFAHHPEQGEMDLADLRDRMSEPWFDPAGLILAVPAERGDLPLLGFHWTKVHRDEDPAYGEVYVVAVNPRAAGRGLGTLLTAAGLEHLARQGVAEVVLYVEQDNAPALAVYQGQGFTTRRTEVQYRGIAPSHP